MPPKSTYIESKLTGTGRAIVASEAAEAVWTEVVGKINELSSFMY